MNDMHVFLADGATSIESGERWTTVLPVGEWKYRPGPGGKPIAKPLRVVEGKSANPDHAIGLADLMEAWEAQAVENVTLPTSHNDELMENSGYVTGLRVAFDPKIKKTCLQARLNITEPDVMGKVERHTIRGRSAGLKFGYVDKESGRKFPVVLDHVALTNKPWIKGMGDMGFSEDSTVVLAPPKNLNQDDVERAVADQLDSWTRGRVELVGLENGVARVLDADGDAWKVSVRVDGSTVHVARAPQWVADVQKPTRTSKGGDMKTANEMTPEELLAAYEAQQDELAHLRTTERTSSVDARIEELKGAGLSEEDGWGGFLAVARSYMLADDGGPAAVLLSENGRTTTELPVTVTEIVEGLIDALPENAGVGLSEQAAKRSAGEKPPANTDDELELTPRQRADKMRAALGIQNDLIEKD